MNVKKCIIIHGCPSNPEKAMNPQTRTYDNNNSPLGAYPQAKAWGITAPRIDRRVVGIEKFGVLNPELFNKHWIPWTKRQLTAKGIETVTPLMPAPWNPMYEAFKKEFEKYSVDEDTVLVGHSCGCAFLVRWLGETKRTIFKLILVAPWKIPDKDDDFRKNFYHYSIDPTIKQRVKEIVMFTADDEEDDGKKSLSIFHHALSGKIIELHGHGHYTFDDMGTEEFPELVEVILS